jgi:hypothetical protein
MKKRSLLALIFAGMAVAMVFAQQNTKKIVYSGSSYMGDHQTQSGSVSKEKFDALITLPLFAKDSNGVEHQVSDFSFTYAERALYQDSTGVPIITTDYFSTTCPGGRLSEDWIKNIQERSKPGDTAYFDYITTIDSTKGKPKMFITTPIQLVISK